MGWEQCAQASPSPLASRRWRASGEASSPGRRVLLEGGAEASWAGLLRGMRSGVSLYPAAQRPPRGGGGGGAMGRLEIVPQPSSPRCTTPTTPAAAMMTVPSLRLLATPRLPLTPT